MQRSVTHPVTRALTRARLGVSLLYVLASLIGASLSARTHAAGGAPDLSPCHIDGIEAQARCGYLDVPIDWNATDGPTLPLFLAVVPPSGGAVSDSPIYVLAGGPGQAASDMGALLESALVPARRGREVILVDQRGTGRTAPFNCETPTDPMARGDEVAARCLAKSDNDPRHFGSDAFVNDLHAVRNALGHSTIHLWGGSYGTRAALLYLARFEHTVQSVILDAVAPPATPFLRNAAQSAGASLTRVTAACAKDTACAAAFPMLESDVARIIDELDEQPRRVRFDGRDIPVDVSVFLNGLRNAFYTRQGTAWAPYVIAEFSRGNHAPWLALSDAASSIMDGVSFGTLLSVMCGEEFPSLAREGSLAAGTPFARIDLSFWDDACGTWPAAEPPAEHRKPVNSATPALILSGALDPVTPPAYGELAARTLSRSRHLVAPFNAHITSGYGCAPRLLGEFLDTLDPASLDDSCLNDIREAPFLIGPAGPTP